MFLVEEGFSKSALVSVHFGDQSSFLGRGGGIETINEKYTLKDNNARQIHEVAGIFSNQETKEEFQLLCCVLIKMGVFVGRPANSIWILEGESFHSHLKNRGYSLKKKTTNPFLLANSSEVS